MNTLIKEFKSLHKEIVNTIQPILASTNLKEAREAIYPVLSQSQFIERGVLTPEEFVISGDKLVKLCDKFKWCSVSSTSSKTYLPHLKQYLILKDVKCSNKICDIGGETMKAIDNETTQKEIFNNHLQLNHTVINNFEMREDHYLEDLEDLENSDLALDEATIIENQIKNENIYDISITYDKYWQVPRIWISGKKINGTHLTSDEIFKDICYDYAKKTVTIENHPYSLYSHVTIHPCGHSHLMLKIIQLMIQDNKTPNVEDYVQLFMIVMQNIMPTLELNYVEI